MTLEDLKTYTALHGIMFTIRYIVERDEWFGIFHFNKAGDSVDTYRDTLEAVIADLIKKADKKIKKPTLVSSPVDTGAKAS
jgi:hypothetical protein